MRRGNLLD
uniref:Uncharacterized protein n=1 Tax=Rhizophora mucronata TaxID=61149 RepID=A0A2P2P247_RHIMU